MERIVKFSQADTRSSGESVVSKNRSKSSTLSLHTLTHDTDHCPHESEEPALQRRNSIHNVPYVDVNDPDTRTRMERYKEERRSMLRAKYKAEDYLSSSFSRKKKVSSNSSQDSSENELASSPDNDHPNKDSQQNKTSSNNVVSTASFVAEQKTDQMFKSEVRLAPVQKKSSNSVNKQSESRPDHLSIIPISNNNSDQRGMMPSNNQRGMMPSNNDCEADDSVNVRERASMFGPRKFTESKVRTVSAPSAPQLSQLKLGSESPAPVSRKYSSQHSHPSPSPSKIRSMAALFEQKQ